MVATNTTANALVQVNFHGDTLDAVRDGDKVWVSLRRCCENLGLDLETQRRKLRGKAWAVTGEMPATGPDGKSYVATCVDLDTLPGWLFSIDARKVKEQVREKLAQYQREAARVLADHFFRRQEQPTTSALLTAVLRRLDALEERTALPAGSRSNNVGPMWTVQDVLLIPHDERGEPGDGADEEQPVAVLRHGVIPNLVMKKSSGTARSVELLATVRR